MTEPNPIAPSASESLFGFLRRLHPMTRFIIAVAVLHLAGEAAVVWRDLSHFNSYGEPGVNRLDIFVVAQEMRLLSLPFLDLGTAATIEFLFRIWEELKVRRKASSDPV
jgi:hypothetical protein